MWQDPPQTVIGDRAGLPPGSDAPIAPFLLAGDPAGWGARQWQRYGPVSRMRWGAHPLVVVLGTAGHRLVQGGPTIVRRRPDLVPSEVPWPPLPASWSLATFAAWLRQGLADEAVPVVQALAATLPALLGAGGDVAREDLLQAASLRWCCRALLPLAEADHAAFLAAWTTAGCWQLPQASAAAIALPRARMALLTWLSERVGGMPKGTLAGRLWATMPGDVSPVARAATLLRLFAATAALLGRRLQALVLALQDQPRWWPWGAEPAWQTACLAEVLRLDPVHGVILRELRAAIGVADYVLPAGWLIATVPAYTHMRSGAFPHPQVFQPARFLGSAPGANWLGWDDDWRGHLMAQLVLPALRAVLGWCPSPLGTAFLQQVGPPHPGKAVAA